MAEILSTVSNASFGLAVVFFILAVFFWFKFDILGIIGDLSGRTARKSIAKMRENNAKTVIKVYRSSKSNITRDGLTDRMMELGGLKHTEAVTEKLAAKPESVAEGTALLEGETTEPLPEKTETPISKNVATVGWRILEDIMLIHTDEFIG